MELKRIQALILAMPNFTFLGEKFECKNKTQMLVAKVENENRFCQQQTMLQWWNVPSRLTCKHSILANTGSIYCCTDVSINGYLSKKSAMETWYVCLATKHWLAIAVWYNMLLQALLRVKPRKPWSCSMAAEAGFNSIDEKLLLLLVPNHFICFCLNLL